MTETESIKFRSQAMAFASSSSGTKPFTVKEEVWFNFRKTFRNQMKNFKQIKATCALGMEVSNTLVDPVQRLVKNAAPVKRKCGTVFKNVWKQIPTKFK